MSSTLVSESNPDLVEIIRQEIEREGCITFARFMELAIYHPEHGYYATGEVRAGTEGDFLTGPETDPIFGHALARQIAECHEFLDAPARFTVREAGSGRGTLARDVLDGLRAAAPKTYDAVIYELVEQNQQRMDDALERLRDAGHGDRVRQVTEDEPIEGVVLANELLDAFPFHRLVYRDGELREIYTAWRDGWFDDEEDELSDPILADPLHDVRLQEGQLLEVSPAAEKWAARLAGQLMRGYAILIDYGYPSPERYASERADGTLRTYREHLVGIEPYRFVGRQDITAHVDFTAVCRAAERGGMVELGLVPQALFFAGLGIEELLLKIQRESEDPYRYVNAREAVMQLLDPRGLGRFRVLVLGKDVDPERELRGLSFSMPGFPV